MIRNILRRAVPRLVDPLQEGMASTRATQRAAASTAATRALNLEHCDATQVQLLDEQCILVDERDTALGSCSKKDCHLMENINKEAEQPPSSADPAVHLWASPHSCPGFLHRAFSVFLFNSKDELLLQQRSDAKITFPGRFTNTCCSHPLHVPDELEETDALGIKRAARRRLFVELGIDPKEVSIDDIRYLTRILYKAPSDSTWGENEIDYILFVRKDVAIKPNPNEVKESLYVSRGDILPFISSLEGQGQVITPWFKLVVENFLFEWWANLHNLSKFEDHTTIHRLTTKSS